MKNVIFGIQKIYVDNRMYGIERCDVVVPTSSDVAYEKPNNSGLDLELELVYKEFLYRKYSTFYIGPVAQDSNYIDQFKTFHSIKVEEFYPEQQHVFAATPGKLQIETQYCKDVMIVVYIMN